MLDVARHRKAGRFLHISTDEVGGDMPADGWFREDDRLFPSSPYAASKTAAEHFVPGYGHTFGLDVLVTRTKQATTALISFRKSCCRWRFRMRSTIARYRFMEMVCRCATGSTWPTIAARCSLCWSAVPVSRADVTTLSGGHPLANIDVLKLLLVILRKAGIAADERDRSPGSRPPVCGRVHQDPARARVASGDSIRGGVDRDGELVPGQSRMGAPVL